MGGEGDGRAWMGGTQLYVMLCYAILSLSVSLSTFPLPLLEEKEVSLSHPSSKPQVGLSPSRRTVTDNKSPT